MGPAPVDAKELEMERYSSKTMEYLEWAEEVRIVLDSAPPEVESKALALRIYDKGVVDQKDIKDIADEVVAELEGSPSDRALVLMMDHTIKSRYHEEEVPFEWPDAMARGTEQVRDILAAEEMRGRALSRVMTTEPQSVAASLDHLEFSARVSQLREANRIDHQTEQNLMDMAEESTDLTDFRTRMNYGGPRMMGSSEYQFLVTTLDTPEGQAPQTWDQAEAYARAYGSDRYESVCNVPQMEADCELQQQVTAGY